MASGDEDPSARTPAATAATASEEERWIVIDGRRWRRTDPALPDDAAARLRSHLGRARSAVRTTKRDGDVDATAAARRRVGLAKAGLGERGPRWWDDAVPARVRRAEEALAELDRLAPPAAGASPAADRGGDGRAGEDVGERADGGAGVNA